MEQPKKEKYKNKSEIRQHKDVDWIEKAMGILTHPLTAFGYTARNEDLPDNFEKAENTNNLDDVIGIINPARRIKSGIDAMEDLGKGDLKKAALNTIGAINPWSKRSSLLTGTSRASRNAKTAQAISNSATYIPKMDTGIEGTTGMDFADLLEKGRENKKKLKK